MSRRRTTIDCPFCKNPMTVYPPDTTRKKYSITPVQNGFPIPMQCSNCKMPIPLFWY